jgi:hypothetical protein
MARGAGRRQGSAEKISDVSYQIVVEGEHRELEAREHAQLVEQVRHMMLHRVVTEHSFRAMLLFDLTAATADAITEPVETLSEKSTGNVGQPRRNGYGLSVGLQATFSGSQESSRDP